MRVDFLFRQRSIVKFFGVIYPSARMQEPEGIFRMIGVSIEGMVRKDFAQTFPSHRQSLNH
jgi:hypothetical protein